MRKMMKLFSLMASIALAGAALPVLADMAATTPAATPAATMAMTAPTIAVHGLVDTYYTYNFTNSSKNMNGRGNTGYNYGPVDLNSMDDDFSLSVAELEAKMTDGPISGTVALWTQSQSEVNGINLLVAFASYNINDFTFTAGRFGDWMGNEEFNTNKNWNYSHSLLYNYTLPLWLQGVDIKYAPSDSLQITGYATAGWVNDPGNFGDFGKTYGLKVSMKPDASWGIVLNGIAGPEGGFFSTIANPGDSLYVGEAIISYAASTDFSLALDGEYGGLDPVKGDVIPSPNPLLIPPTPLSLSSETFWGADLYAKLKISDDWNVALRLEELESSNNWLYNSGVPSAIGNPYVERREATLTISNKVTSNLLLRVEGRYDMGCTGGTTDSSPDGVFVAGSGDQLTGTGSAVLSF